MRKLLIHTWDDEDVEMAEKILRKSQSVRLLVLMAVFVITLFLICGICHAENIDGYSIDQWTNAIGKAENSKKHPYGILTRYRHTTPLQACRNTVLHKWQNYQATSQRKRFLSYLANAYCPIGGNNDNGTCKNWEGNVDWWLKRG